MSTERTPLKPVANLPPTPGRQVKYLKAELEKKDNENEALKSNIADLTKALESLQFVTEKATTLDIPLHKGNSDEKKRKKKDPNAPAPHMTAYRYFCEDMKDEKSDGTEDMRLKWKECQGDARKKYTDLAAADKKRFDKENETYQKQVAEKEAEEKALEMYYEKQKQDIAMEFYEAHIKAQNITNEKNKKKVKDPDAPKRAMSSYMYFAQEKREDIAKKNPGKSLTEIAKILGEEWGKLNKGKGGKNGTKKYDTLAAKDKIRYEKEKAVYDALKSEREQRMEQEREMQLRKDKEEAMKLIEEIQQENAAQVQALVEVVESEPIKKEKKKKDKPKGPKRPSSAYIFFTKETRTQIKAGMPEATTQQELLAEVGRQWKSLSDKDKKKYVDMAIKDKERYEKELEAMKEQEATK